MKEDRAETGQSTENRGNALAGKVALVTGGASGMGEATVRRFVAEGARVAISDIQVEKGRAVAAETGAVFLEHDVADDAAWRRVMATIEREFGRLDVVMNNAGIVTHRSIEEIDLATWARVIGINQTGVMLGCHYGVAQMRRNPGGSSGSIVNVASTAAFTAIPGDVGYSATKNAVRGITKSVAVHCARAGLNIRCNTIVPGAIDTPILDGAKATIPNFMQAVAGMSPFGRIGKGSEIAAMAVFLASDQSSFSTGAEFKVDGGMLAAHPGM